MSGVSPIIGAARCPQVSHPLALGAPVRQIVGTPEMLADVSVGRLDEATANPARFVADQGLLFEQQ